MFALIDPRINRVCQLDPNGFSVATPLFWVACDNTVIPDSTTYVNGAFVQPPPPPTPAPPQPPQASVDAINALAKVLNLSPTQVQSAISALPTQ